jgi:hypothetical protein
MSEGNMALNIQTGMFAVLRDGTVTGPIKHTVDQLLAPEWPWEDPDGETYDNEGRSEFEHNPWEFDIVATFATRAEALAYVADDPDMGDNHPDGPDLASVPVTAAAMTDAARDVLAERKRQVQTEGWTPEHDDSHGMGEMARAAATYAMVGSAGVIDRGDGVPTTWPWSAQWWKPSDRRRDLVKAGALILAEIERLDRATGPDLAPAPVTVPKVYAEADAQAMVAAALRQAVRGVSDLPHWIGDDDSGTTLVALQEALSVILALIPQPAAPAPVVVDWQARAEAAEARGMERAAEIVSEAIKRWQDDEREEFHPDDPECPNYLEEAVTLIHSLVPAILAAAKESKA